MCSLGQPPRGALVAGRKGTKSLEFECLHLEKKKS